MLDDFPSNAPAQFSKEEVPFHSERGGMWVNGARMTWPFAKMELFSWGFKLTGARFTPQNVVELRRRSGWLSNGIDVVHLNPNAPKFIVYWTFNFARLAAELSKIGFSVVQD